uniref:Uncharacterized protein n=1 Tax=Coccidioides posadasii RMSCC 3488 TaxID=454284 RepID=A0A0J6FUU1_COCPO|nr:hypothetical protein CPAG_09469 [Coccidioides posadasii RMSCC 3488]
MKLKSESCDAMGLPASTPKRRTTNQRRVKSPPPQQQGDRSSSDPVGSTPTVDLVVSPLHFQEKKILARLSTRTPITLLLSTEVQANPQSILTMYLQGLRVSLSSGVKKKPLSQPSQYIYSVSYILNFLIKSENLFLELRRKCLLAKGNRVSLFPRNRRQP